MVSARKRSEGVDHYAEVRYEELVTEPEATLRRVCAFTELPFDAAMLSYHEHAAERLEEIDRDLPARRGRHELDAEARISAHARASEPPAAQRIGAWREEMAPDDVAAFEAEAGDVLAELGYETGGSGRMPGF